MMSLQNLAIMVTRPKPQGEMLCARIQAASGNPIYFPTMEIVPAANQGQFKSLAQCDRLIFISPQAVYHSANKIHLSSECKIIALGLSTAAALKEAHLPVHAYPQDDWSSEGVLDLPLLQQIEGKNIGIVCAETGRPLLMEVLTARGANVYKVIAYHRVLPNVDTAFYKTLLIKRKVDIIVCTSNEVLQNLVTLIGVQPVPLLVISKRMVEFAKSLGFESIFLANNASHDAIIAELVKQKGHLCHMKKKT